ncbi:PfkB family carbohydrate kinase, partial [Streptococcus suis]
VLVCKETHDTEVSQLRDELLKFLPYVSMITPNLAEAQLLLQKDIKTVEEMKQAAVALYDFGAKAVVIKGGDRLGGPEAVDVFYDGQEIVVLQSPLLSEN